MWNLFCREKHLRTNETGKRGIWQLLTPSLLGIVMCTVCLAGTTWAWFAADLQTGSSTLTAAQYGMSVSVTAKNNSGESVTNNTDGSYTLTDGVYTVTLTATGTASVGYCKIICGENIYYTAAIRNATEDTEAESLTFELTMEGSGTVTFIGVWGTYSGTDGIVENNGSVTITGEKSTSETPAAATEEPAKSDTEVSDNPTESETTVVETDQNTETIDSSYTEEQTDTYSEEAENPGDEQTSDLSEIEGSESEQ